MLKFLSIFVIFILLPGSMLLMPKTQEENETQKEYVEVINVEVIVRALSKGKLVGNLKKSNFTLYENGEKQEITSFMEIRRKIGKEATEYKEKEISEKPGKKRLFLLFFLAYRHVSQYQRILDSFFNRIFQEGDYALLIIENQVFKFTQREQISQTLAQVKTKLNEVSKWQKMEYELLIKRVKDLFRTLEDEFRNEQRRFSRRGTESIRKKQLVEQLKKDYKRLWEEYKYKHINLNVDKLKVLAASLKKVNFEKWGVVFYSRDTFPQFNPESFIVGKQESLKNLFELRKFFNTFSSEIKKPSSLTSTITEIQQAFIDANATFHLLLSDKSSLGQFNSQYLTVDYIYSDWQEAFRNITNSTGGEVIDNNNFERSFAQVVEKEDIYYRLTYTPQITGEKIRKIEIKTKKKRVKLMYNRQVILKKASEISIDNFSFTYPALQFTLNNYQQLYDGNRLYGDIEIKITAVDSKGEMLAFGKALEPGEEKMTVSLKMNFPRGGKYTLIIEALDKHTGRTSVFSERVNVPKTSLDGPVLITKVHKKTKGIDKKNKLDVILKKSAKYCEKLEKTTFYFTCKEEVADIYFIKGKKVKDDLYLHDYQILMEENGKMSEKREPVRKTSHKKKRKKKKKEDEKFFLTNFFSEYPFLMPVTMLARENQKNYRYQLLSKEKVGKVKTFKLSVEPKKKGVGGINHGVVWVDEKDGSVVKIELNPSSLIGIRALKATARRKGTRIRVTDIHWYDVKKNTVRFPSRTEISEINLARHGGDTKQPEEVEHSRTVFAYKNYLFFNVNVNVTDAHHK